MRMQAKDDPLAELRLPPREERIMAARLHAKLIEIDLGKETLATAINGAQKDWVDAFRAEQAHNERRIRRHD